jgi:Ca2+/H+ antiporter
MDWLEAVVFVVALTVAAVGGLVVVRRRIDHATLSKHNDVGGVVFSIVGTLYAVILAFVVMSSGNYTNSSGFGRASGPPRSSPGEPPT